MSRIQCNILRITLASSLSICAYSGSFGQTADELLVSETAFCLANPKARLGKKECPKRKLVEDGESIKISELPSSISPEDGRSYPTIYFWGRVNRPLKRDEVRVVFSRNCSGTDERDGDRQNLSESVPFRRRAKSGQIGKEIGDVVNSSRSQTVLALTQAALAITPLGRYATGAKYVATSLGLVKLLPVILAPRKSSADSEVNVSDYRFACKGEFAARLYDRAGVPLAGENKARTILLVE